jgi:hypothetical protein
MMVGNRDEYLNACDIALYFGGVLLNFRAWKQRLLRCYCEIKSPYSILVAMRSRGRVAVRLSP